MIDFRYHIVSIVAVLLALSVGIVMGSGVIGGPLLDDLQNRADRIEKTNATLRAQATERLAEINRQRAFMAAAEPYLTAGALSNVSVVLIRMEGVDGGAVSDLGDSIVDAGGSIASEIRLTDRFRLDDEIDIDALALATGSTSGEGEELRLDAARSLGSRAAAVARSRSTGPPTSASNRLESLLDDLEQGGFVEVEGTADRSVVPEGAAFLIVAGSSDEPPFEVAPMLSALAVELGNADTGTLVAETSGSVLEVVGSIRDESAARGAVATADNADDVFGRVAGVLALARAVGGEILHVGTASGADSPLPEPSPTQ